MKDGTNRNLVNKPGRLLTGYTSAAIATGHCTSTRTRTCTATRTRTRTGIGTRTAAKTRRGHINSNKRHGWHLWKATLTALAAPGVQLYHHVTETKTSQTCRKLSFDMGSHGRGSLGHLHHPKKKSVVVVVHFCVFSLVVFILFGYFFSWLCFLSLPSSSQKTMADTVKPEQMYRLGIGQQKVVTVHMPRLWTNEAIFEYLKFYYGFKTVAKVC
jgi:hypothetical protein